uniref:Beta-ketoacyl synthase-like N-terminal domain-containing protein n=1 Tax=Timema tahoe TaxID=61484 RepID=A0A7R9FLN3_9NEOP|nr:unnamed protein product [Timema tahoe]
MTDVRCTEIGVMSVDGVIDREGQDIHVRSPVCRLFISLVAQSVDQGTPMVVYMSFIMSKNDSGEIADNDIVISGIAGYFPESLNVDQLKEKLFNNGKFITLCDSPNWNRGHLDIPKLIGRLPKRNQFDSSFFGIHSQQTSTLDPMTRNMIERSFEAIIDSGQLTLSKAAASGGRNSNLCSGLAVSGVTVTRLETRFPRRKGDETNDSNNKTIHISFRCCSRGTSFEDMINFLEHQARFPRCRGGETHDSNIKTMHISFRCCSRALSLKLHFPSDAIHARRSTQCVGRNALST